MQGREGVGGPETQGGPPQARPRYVLCPCFADVLFLGYHLAFGGLGGQAFGFVGRGVLAGGFLAIAGLRNSRIS